MTPLQLWVKAEQARRKAEANALKDQAAWERRIITFREAERIAYRRLYESVSCEYCKAQAGEPCAGITIEGGMHTSRCADCMLSPGMRA